MTKEKIEKEAAKQQREEYERYLEEMQRQDTKKRTADRKSTRPQHELHDSPWVWYPIIALLVLWVLWMVWQGLQAIII